MTERGGGVARDASSWSLGASSLRWEGGALIAELDERRAPFGGKIRGRLRFEPSAATGAPIALDAAARHHWYPAAPHGVAEVELDEPRLTFRGHGYHDLNFGPEPLEDAMRRWWWSRMAVPGGTAIGYDAVWRGGGGSRHAALYGEDGTVTPLADLELQRLPRTLWGLGQRTRGSEGARPKILYRWEDGPFYARSVVASEHEGARSIGVHETLSLDRFRSEWVRFLLPYRMRIEP